MRFPTTKQKKNKNKKKKKKCVRLGRHFLFFLLGSCLDGTVRLRIAVENRVPGVRIVKRKERKWKRSNQQQNTVARLKWGIERSAQSSFFFFFFRLCRTQRESTAVSYHQIGKPNSTKIFEQTVSTNIQGNQSWNSIDGDWLSPSYR